MNLRINVLWKQHIVALLLILVVGFAAYANTFGAPFTFDDDLSIAGNPDIRSIENLTSFSIGEERYPHRFVVYRTFALNYHFGGLDPTGYHLVNLLIHLAAAMLVYALLRLTLQTPFFLRHKPCITAHEETPHPSPLTPHEFIPLFGALLFVAHPVQTQAVTYIVQRLTSLATMFYLLSVVLYVVARLWMERKAEGGRQKAEYESQPESVSKPVTESASFWFILPLTGSVLAAVLAMKCKEIAVTLPLAILLYELCFFRGTWRRRFYCLLPILATLPIVPLSVLAVGDSTGDILSDVSEKSSAAGELSRTDYLFTQFRVIITYLRLLVLPVNQNVDYDYPIYTSFFTPPVLLSFLLLVGMLGLAVYLLVRSRPVVDIQKPGAQQCAPTGESALHLTPHSSRAVEAPSPQPPAPSPGSPPPELRLIAFGILWFFLTLAVESSIIPIQDVIFEHRLYLPGFGATLAFAAGFFLVGTRLFRRPGDRWLVIAAVVIVAALAVTTFQRNQLWGSKLSLWQDSAAKSPQKGRPLNNYAVALEDTGRRDEAIKVLLRAVEVEPTYHRAWYNLGDLFLVSGYPLEALLPLQTAIELKSDFTEAYVKYAAALLRGRQYGEVVAFLEYNMARVAANAEARFYLGSAHAFLGNRQAALDELAVVAKLDRKLAATLAGLLGRR